MIPQGWLLAGGRLAYPPKEISRKFPPNAQVASRFNPVHVKRLNCRIPCHFEAAHLKRLDMRIRSRKYHPSPGKLLTILRSGYVDTRIPGGKHRYLDTRIRGYADITHGDWIPTSCNILQNALSYMQNSKFPRKASYKYYILRSLKHGSRPAKIAIKISGKFQLKLSN